MKKNQMNTSEVIHPLTKIFVLTHDEQRCIIRNSYAHSLGFLIRFLMYTGITVSELRNLLWLDIDAYYSRVYIAKEPYPRNLTPGLYDQEGYSQRCVPILPHLLKELLEWKALQECACPAGTCLDSRPVAATLDGQLLTAEALQECFNEVLHSCGMAHYPISALRDTYAARALEQGMHPRYLNIIMGDPSAGQVYSMYIATASSANMALMETLYTVRPRDTVNFSYPVIVSVLEDGTVDLYAPDFPWAKLHTDNLPIGMGILKNKIAEYIDNGGMPPVPTNAFFIECHPNQYLLLLYFA